MKKIVKTFPILSYLVFTFAITWTFWWIPLFYELSNDITFGVYLIGGLGPPIAALILIHIISDVKIRINSIKLFWGFFILCLLILIWKFYMVEKGGADWNGFYPKLTDFQASGIIIAILGCLFLALNASNAPNKSLKENYLKTLLFDKAKIKWYLFALLFYPLLYLSSYLIGALFGFKTSETLFDFNFSLIPGFLFIMFIAGGTEEFGWRGFLLKELQKKYNPLIATLFVGFFWSLWHLPMYFNGVYSTEGFSAYLPSMIHTFQISLLFTWLYNKSGYSILAVIILHAMNNTVGSIFGSSFIPAMVMAVLFMIIIIIDSKMWKRRNYANEIYSYDDK